MSQYNPKTDFFYKKVRKNIRERVFRLKSGIRGTILFVGTPGLSAPHAETFSRLNQPGPHMKSAVLLSIFCLMLCFCAASCRSAADADEGSAVLSEVLEIEDCVLTEPYMLVTPDVLDALPEAVRDEAKKYCGNTGTVVVASSLHPRYFRLIRRRERLLLGSDDPPSARNTVYLSVIAGLGEAADSIRSIKIENPASPDPWDLGIFMKRYPELADRIGELPSDDERLNALAPAARELLSRGSTRVMLERHSRTKDPSALEEAVRAEQEQIGVLESILGSN